VLEGVAEGDVATHAVTQEEQRSAGMAGGDVSAERIEVGQESAVAADVGPGPAGAPVPLMVEVMHGVAGGHERLDGCRTGWSARRGRG
jgi:hypothetical protein